LVSYLTSVKNWLDANPNEGEDRMLPRQTR
jgi:hypothetical protein